MLYRKISENIKNWILNGKDAFLLTGARQVGKTSIIRECLKELNQDYVELNFIDKPELISIFGSSKNAKDLLLRLSLVCGRSLTPKTIIFFDEIQEFKDIITRIKFLVDDNSYRYIMSGSLLGVELSDIRSSPVGYLEIWQMYPMCFEEFVLALGVSEEIISNLNKCFEKQCKVDDYIHEKMMDLFYLYLIVGGMPEVVDTYLKTNNLKSVEDVHHKIIEAYKIDFSKYEKNNKLSLVEIYDALPGQLNNMNKRFKINEIGKNALYERKADSFIWLKNAGVVIPVYNITEPKLPLILNEKRSLFKLFNADIGLLTSSYSNETKLAILNKDKDINNGAIFENCVAQELLYEGYDVYYFNSKQYGELDFVIEDGFNVLPIEVKSGKAYKKHSALNNVLNIEAYKINKAYILCDGNVEIDGKKIYLPIYMLMFIKKKQLENPVYKVDINGLM